MPRALAVERQRRRVTLITGLTILPVIALAWFSWSAVHSAGEAREAQLRTAAAFAGEIAQSHVEHMLVDYFQPRQLKLLTSRGESQAEFERALHWVFLSAELMDTPQFLPDSELKQVILAENSQQAGGHDVAHVAGDPEPGRSAVLMVLRDHMAHRARQLMGVDPTADTLLHASVAATGLAQQLEGPHLAWLRIDVQDSSGAACAGCERYVRKVGVGVGEGRYALLAVTFPLPGTPDEEPGLFGAIVPLPLLREKFLLPALARGPHAAAVEGHGRAVQTAETTGELSRATGEEEQSPPPELAAASLGARLRLVEISDDGVVSSASGPGASGGEVLYEEPLLGDGSPWRIQAIRVAGFGDGWGRALGAWPMVFVAFGGLLVAAVVLLGRSNLHQMEVAHLRRHLVSNLSHELKTPLSLIRLYSETLEHGRIADEAERQKFLEIISREAKRLTHLINNILDVDRIEGGRKAYSYSQVSPSRIVRSTLEAYRFQLAEQGFELRLDVDDGLPLMMIDEEALAQALINLLDNAAKYSDTSKEISVRLFRRGPLVGLAVTDRGIGIPHAEQRRIFQPFYRVEQGLVHDVKGSGLGLAVVRHVAHAHGGDVEVASTPGKGSTFTIWLRVDFEPAAA